MSNHHSFDDSVALSSMRVEMKRWTDGYWQLDFRVTDNSREDTQFCVPLFSGRRPITQSEREQVIHLCALGVVTLTVLDEGDPFP